MVRPGEDGLPRFPRLPRPAATSWRNPQSFRGVAQVEPWFYPALGWLEHRDAIVRSHRCHTLVLIANDDLIAGILNRNGLKTGNGHRWTRERVTSMRSNYRIPVFKPAEGGIEPWLNLSNAAKLLRIAPKTLRLAAEAGEIEAIHVSLPDGPWVFARAALATSAARSIAERARQNPRYPAGSHPDQQNLFSSTT